MRIRGKRPTIKNYNKYCRPLNPFPLEWGCFSGGDYVIDVYEWSLKEWECRQREHNCRKNID
jgi:hypothetical protein